MVARRVYVVEVCWRGRDGVMVDWRPIAVSNRRADAWKAARQHKARIAHTKCEERVRTVTYVPEKSRRVRHLGELVETPRYPRLGDMYDY